MTHADPKVEHGREEPDGDKSPGGPRRRMRIVLHEEAAVEKQSGKDEQTGDQDCHGAHVRVLLLSDASCRTPTPLSRRCSCLTARPTFPLESVGWNPPVTRPHAGLA